MPDAYDLERLTSLKNNLISIRRSHVPTMNYYTSGDGCGFWHQPTRRAEASRSSTATCVTSLVRANLWKHKDGKWGETSKIAAKLIKEPWTSADLAKNNPFSLSFIAEGILDLAKTGPYEERDEHLKTVRERIAPAIVKHLKDGGGEFGAVGAVAIKPYPPSAYLTQLALRVLKRPDAGEALTTALTRQIRAWSISEIHRQVALLATKSRIADPIQLGYALTIAVSAGDENSTTPEDKALFSGALKVFFEAQNDDGSWNLSQPIFHYPAVGNAHGYDFELLTQLLAAEALWEDLLLYLEQLERAAARLKAISFDLGLSDAGKAIGWASGHHPQIPGPESWSTACVYDFVHALDRLVAEATRRVLFREVGGIYSPPRRPSGALKDVPFAPGFLDARLWDGQANISLRDAIEAKFVKPISKELEAVAYGGSLNKDTAMSAILFGPPGTSKTQLARKIADYIGWPLLSVDPSYVIQDGIDQIYTRANTLFNLLTMTEEVVVLLDEFDEMGRSRDDNDDILSRFITTSMLPKLAAINEERKIVILLATNYVSRFDAAFSRGGRFDLVIQVMPPTAEEKLAADMWSPGLKDALSKITSDKKRNEAKDFLEDLTFLETVQLVKKLATSDEPFDDIQAAHKNCTLEREDRKIGKECVKERRHIRL